MIKVIVAGAAGRMGSRLVALIKDSADLTLAGAIEGKGHPALSEDAGEAAGCGKTGITITDDLSALLERGEVVIDFSAPQASLHHLRAVAQHRRAMVIGTTGFSPPELEELKTLARQVPCVCSPNMSVGVNLMYRVIGEMAKTLGDEYDIEVIEAHHRLKKDAPSGTALKIA
jgi:4-hydroxy-tetrahydrodipicolinate reductase